MKVLLNKSLILVLCFVFVGLVPGCEKEPKEGLDSAKRSLVGTPEVAKTLPADKPHEKVVYKTDERTGFIIDEGFDVVSTQCVICHSAKLVTQNRGNREHWKGLIVWMQKTQGLWAFPPPTEKRILDYLSKHYGAIVDGRRPALAKTLRPPAAPRNAADDDVKRAQTQIGKLKKALMGTLKPALKEGPVLAVEACQLSAPAIPKAAGSARVKVGRASSRLRNKSNQPPSWVMPLLGAMEASPDMAYLTVERPQEGKKNGLGYVEPIRMKGVCLKCHGENVAPNVKETLAKHYPTDAAMGYKLGDFRGVFWAEVAP